MKNLLIYFLLYCLLASVPEISQAASIKHTSPALEVIPAAKGAANLTELARGILQALQENNFDQLTAYLPGDVELTLIKRRSSEDMKAVLENISATDYKNNLQTQYEKLVQEGLSRTINWADMQVAEARPGKGTRKNKMLQPVVAVMQNKESKPVQLAFEAIKLNNRYFLFQRMQLKP